MVNEDDVPHERDGSIARLGEAPRILVGGPIGDARERARKAGADAWAATIQAALEAAG